MDKEKLHTIFQPKGCYSFDDLERYHLEMMDRQEAHALENHLLDCKLCSEVVDSFSFIDAKKHIQITGNVNEKIRVLFKSKEKVPGIWWRAAAVGIVLIAAGGIYYLVENKTGKDDMVVQQVLPQKESKEADTLHPRDVNNEVAEKPKQNHPIQKAASAEQKVITNNEPNKIEKRVSIANEDIPFIEATTDKEGYLTTSSSGATSADTPDELDSTAFASNSLNQIATNPYLDSLENNDQDALAMEGNRDPEIADRWDNVEDEKAKREEVVNMESMQELAKPQPTVIRQMAAQESKATVHKDSKRKNAQALFSTVQEDDASTTEEIPQFPGGQKEMNRFIKNNFKMEGNTPIGEVKIQVTITKTGEINNIKLLKGLNDYFNEESIRVIQSMPNWIPGKKEGKPVKAQVIIPINFPLQ